MLPRKPSRNDAGIETIPGLDSGNQAQSEFGNIAVSAPELLTDGADPTYRGWDAGAGDPESRVDRAIAAARLAVFPEHGLDPFDPR